MSDIEKCPKCGSTEWAEEDCGVCEGFGYQNGYEDCDECDGTGTNGEIHECLKCGEKWDAS